MSAARSCLLLIAAIVLGPACSASDDAASPDARPAIDGPLAGTPDARLAGTPDAPSAGTPDASPQGGADAATSCPSSQDLCDGTCLPRTSTGNCHGGCNVCPTPANGVATCDGQSCGV